GTQRLGAGVDLLNCSFAAADVGVGSLSVLAQALNRARTDHSVAAMVFGGERTNRALDRIRAEMEKKMGVVRGRVEESGAIGSVDLAIAEWQLHDVATLQSCVEGCRQHTL